MALSPRYAFATTATQAALIPSFLRALILPLTRHVFGVEMLVEDQTHHQHVARDAILMRFF